MPNPTELLPRTGIAATSWVTGSDAHIRVYTQDIDGNIRESRYENGWSGGTSGDIVAKTKPNSPIAVVSFDNGKIRVYYISNDNIVSEVWQDFGGKWFDGELNQARAQATPESRLAVVGKTWDDIHMSVYYQRPDGAIGEMKRDGKNNKWIRGATNIGDKASSGTGLAALSFPANNPTGIRLYYQLTDGTLAEAGIDKNSGWFNRGGFKSTTAAYTTQISTISTVKGQDYAFQVFFLGKQNALTLASLGPGGWGPEQRPTDLITTPSSSVASVTVYGTDSYRVYVQAGDNQIQELVKEQQAPWAKGAIIPTGPTI